MRSLINTCSLMFLTCALMSRGLADVYYVAKSGNVPDGDFASWDTAAENIQDAVTKAVTGSTIYVGPGEYTNTSANIVSIPAGKSLSFIGDLEDPSRVVIDGEGSRRGITKAWSAGDEFVIKGFTFTNCAEKDGAAINFSNRFTDGSATVEKCRFVGNIGTGTGAGIYAYGGYDAEFPFLIKDCLFLGNIASSGGAAFLRQLQARVEDCDFIENYGSTSAGALYIYSDNRSETTKDSITEVDLVNCNFISNRTEYVGGAVRTFSSGGETKFLELRAQDCLFQGNTTLTNEGGAIYLKGSLAATNCIFRGNAAASGGAIYYYQYPEFSLNNCLFHDNVSNPGGTSNTEAIFLYYGKQDYVFENCTFVNNSGGIYYFRGVGDWIMRNSILYDNKRDDGVLANVSFNTSGDFTVLLENDCFNELPASEYLGEGNIAADPKFVSPETGDFRLRPSSPCIDAGKNSEWMEGGFDLDGKPRLDRVSGVVDMGCYEYVTVGTILILR